MKKKSIVIAHGTGGFGLTCEAHELYLQRANLGYYELHEHNKTTFIKVPAALFKALRNDASTHGRLKELNDKYAYSAHSIPRDDAVLVSVVRELGPAAAPKFSKLVVIDIAGDVTWRIEEKFGMECVVTKCASTEVKDSSIWHPVSYTPGDMLDNEVIVYVVKDDVAGLTSHTCTWGKFMEHISLISGMEVYWHPISRTCPAIK